jgi:hypothetical protein
VQPDGIAADPATGAIYLTGEFSGVATFGSYVLTPDAGARDMFVVKLDASGKVVWANQIGGTMAAGVGAIAYANHTVKVKGKTTGGLTIAGTSIPPGLFVVRYDEGGAMQWVTSCAGDAVGFLTVDPTNNDAILTGSATTLQCGTTKYSSPTSDRDAFVSRLGAAKGDVVKLTVEAAGPGNQGAGVSAADSDGSIFFTLGGDQDFQFGPQSIKAGAACLAKVAANGTYLWAKCLGSDPLAGVAVDTDKDAFLWIDCATHTADYGCGALLQTGPTSNDVCLAKLSGVDGSCVWSRRLGVADSQWLPTAVAANSKGEVAVTGRTGGGPSALQIDGRVISTSGFVAQFEGAHGALQWLDGFNFSYATAAFSKQDTLAITGEFNGTVDFGTGPLTSSGTDMFVALIAP